MGAEIEMLSRQLAERQLCRLAKKFRGDPRVGQTLFPPHHRWRIVAVPLCVPERQGEDIGSKIQAAAIRRYEWRLVSIRAFYGKAVISTLQICCHGHVAHGTSWLYHSVSVSTALSHIETSTL